MPLGSTPVFPAGGGNKSRRLIEDFATKSGMSSIMSDSDTDVFYCQIVLIPRQSLNIAQNAKYKNTG